jgi:hypothetical protein
MARLETPLYVFGRGFGRELSHPDQDLVGVNGSPVGKKRDGGGLGMVVADRGRKRRSPGSGTPRGSAAGTPVPDDGDGGGDAPKKRARVRFADEDGGEE